MNWSLLLNVLLLAGVVVAIVRTLKARRQDTQKITQPVAQPNTAAFDEIISVRKIEDTPLNKPVLSPKPRTAVVTPSFKRHLNETLVAQPKISASAIDLNQAEASRQFQLFAEPEPEPESEYESEITSDDDLTSELEPESSIQATSELPSIPTDRPLMMFLLAQTNRQLAGYELLQAVLATGFRFGEGDLFHRHQYPNGQGPIMCSLAAATPTGVFDLQNIGGFVVRGLCLYMHKSGDPLIDAERFDIMMDTAKTLNESLDTQLLDEHKAPLSDASIQYYHRCLSLDTQLA